MCLCMIVYISVCVCVWSTTYLSSIHSSSTVTSKALFRAHRHLISDCPHSLPASTLLSHFLSVSLEVHFFWRYLDSQVWGVIKFHYMALIWFWGYMMGNATWSCVYCTIRVTFTFIILSCYVVSGHCFLCVFVFCWVVGITGSCGLLVLIGNVWHLLRQLKQD